MPQDTGLTRGGGKTVVTLPPTSLNAGSAAANDVTDDIDSVDNCGAIGTVADDVDGKLDGNCSAGFDLSSPAGRKFGRYRDNIRVCINGSTIIGHLHSDCSDACFVL